MAVIYIELKKVKEINNNYFYHVNTNDFGGADFYIKIDKNKQEIYFFENRDYNPAMMKYDLNTRSWEHFSSSNINEKVLPYVIIKSYKAIQNDSFPEYICYAA